MRNSRTARREAGKVGLGLKATARPEVPTNWLQTAISLISRKKTLPEPVKDELSRLLFEMGPDEFANAMRRQRFTQPNIDELIAHLTGGATVGGIVGITEMNK